MYYVLDVENSKWNYYLNKMPLNHRDIYFTSEYYKLCELNGDGIGKLFVYFDKDKIATYPFLMNQIEGYALNDKYYDIQTAYGYGGPATNCHEEKFLSDFESCFIDYCKENNIVAEFIRFHPLIKNEKIFKENIEILHNRRTIYLDLKKDLDSIWNNDITSKNRNMIRKAEKNGLQVNRSSKYEIFKEIYEDTMDKVGANKYYYFKDEYYNELSRNNNYILMNVEKDELVIASAIFMVYGDYFHYHLSGSRKDYLKYAPNNILLWETIKIAHNYGCRYFHFGGGLTDTEDDSLFKFKRSFSKDTSDFYIGKRVHNPKIYNYLIYEWEKKNNKKATLLLQYRY